jgi:glycerol uptake facilitator-like aquaporin
VPRTGTAVFRRQEEPEDIDEVPHKHKLAIECACTFFYVMGATMHKGDKLHYSLQPFVVACVVVLITIVAFPFTGAHCNPALTIAYKASGAPVEKPAALLCAQVVGGVVSAKLAYLLGGYHDGLPFIPDDAGDWVRLAVAEMFGVFLFSFLDLYTALIRPKYGAARPFLLGAAHFVVLMSFRDIPGTTINPALASGLYMTSAMLGTDFDHYVVGVYFGAEIAGGACAGLVIKNISQGCPRCF